MLPAKHRLKGRKEFNDIFRDGRIFSNEVLMIKVGKSEKNAPSRFGFGASLKFSKNAVERNKVKRWMREAVRAKLAEAKPGYNVVFFANPKFPKGKLSFRLISEKIENLLKKAKIL